MNLEIIQESAYFTYIVLPLLIFLARIVDQSLGILRIIFATKGLRFPAFFAGLFESLVWLLAISQIMNQLDNVFCYLAFAIGFATGNVFGIYLEKKISIGLVVVRVIFQMDSKKTVDLLKESNFRITIGDATGMKGPVKMLFSTFNRSDLKRFLQILNKNNPTAFYTVEDVKMVKEGYLQNKCKVYNANVIRK